MASAAPLADGGSIGILAQTDERLSDGSSHWRWDFYSTPLKKFQSNSDIFLILAIPDPTEQRE